MGDSGESWKSRLTASESERDQAIAELRRLILSRLRTAFHNRDGVDESLLEDATQESLMKLLRNLSQFRGASTFETWATAIAVRETFTMLRRRRWKDVSLSQVIAATSFDPVDPVGLPGDSMEKQLLIDAMHRIITDELTEKQRTALLAELKGMPLEEIGRRMGTNRNAVYKLTHDARKRLKHSLTAAGFSLIDLQTA